MEKTQVYTYIIVDIIILCPYMYMYYTMLTLYSIITTQIPELVNSNYMYNHVFHPLTLHSPNLQPVTLCLLLYL